MMMWYVTENNMAHLFRQVFLGKLLQSGRPSLLQPQAIHDGTNRRNVSFRQRIGIGELPEELKDDPPHLQQFIRTDQLQTLNTEHQIAQR